MNWRRSIAYTWIAFSLAGCSMRKQPKAAVVPPPKPSTTVVRPPPQPETPLAELQTRVYLPQPQPIPEEALTVIRMPQRPALAPPAKPEAPRTASTPVVTTPTAPLPQAPPPETVQPPPRQRLRPAESPAERRRIERDIVSRRGQTLRLLNDISRRNLNEEQRAALARIQAFLEQAETAMKNNDLREADALSSRALLLSQDLHSAR